MATTHPSMTKVFIGGSRRLTRLSANVRRHLDRIIEKQLPILIGDANGADRAVQAYLHSCSYRNVEVFCVEGNCRNNVGQWAIRVIPAPKDRQGFAYYAAKDKQMAQEATVGFLLWDGKSMGTLANIYRLVVQQKKAVVYNASTKNFSTLKCDADWQDFLSICPMEVRQRIERFTQSEERPEKVKQEVLF